MNAMRISALALATAVTFQTQPVLATTILNTGGSFIISAPSDNLDVRNGTSVEVTTGGVVTAPDTTDTFGLDGIEAQDASSLTVSGGSVNGGSGESFSGDGISMRDGGSLTVSSGDITGGSSITGRGASGVRTFFNSGTPLSVNITGGTFTGGDSEGSFSGDGLDFSNAAGSVSNATVRGGNGGASGVARGGSGIRLDDASNITLENVDVIGGTTSGGAFGGDALSVFDSEVTILSGSFLGGDSGTFGGDGLQISGSTAIANIFGGTFTGGSNVNSGVEIGSSLDITRGATVNLFGGAFSNDRIDGFDGAFLNVFGSGLDFTNGLLTGTLQGGNEISLFVDSDISVTLFDSAPPALIPVPASVPLLLTGFACLTFAGRRRRAT